MNVMRIQYYVMLFGKRLTARHNSLGWGVGLGRARGRKDKGSRVDKVEGKTGWEERGSLIDCSTRCQERRKAVTQTGQEDGRDGRGG